MSSCVNGERVFYTVLSVSQSQRLYTAYKEP